MSNCVNFGKSLFNLDFIGFGRDFPVEKIEPGKLVGLGRSWLEFSCPTII